MASFLTPVQRVFNSYRRLAAVLLFLVLLLILYKQHSRTKLKSSKFAEVKIEEKSKGSDDKDIMVDSQEVPKHINANNDDDNQDDDGNKDDDHDDAGQEFIKSKAHDVLYKFRSSLSDLELKYIPEYLGQEEKCPACFGTNLCKDITNGNIKIHIPEKTTRDSSKGVYIGKWSPTDKFVVVKNLGNQDEFDKFDRHICRTVVRSTTCDLDAMVINSKSPVMQEKAFQPFNLIQMKQLIGQQSDSLPYASCASSQLISELSRFYDSNGDGKLTAKNIAMYYFSSVINPESVLLQFLNNMKVTLPFPKYWGACGRVIVVEAVGQTLDVFLTADWSFRVDLALQMLDMIDLFINGDPDWGVLFGDFHFDNFAVNEEGQLMVIDVEDVSILDKEKQLDVDSDSLCNWDCISNFGQGMTNINDHHHASYCGQAMEVGSQAMYFFACQLLSDKAKHKFSFQNKEGKELTHGLLGNPPKEQSEDFYGYLDECIMETKAGGRMEAIEGLKQLLESWAYGDDDEGGAINDGPNYHEDEKNEDDNDDNDPENDDDDNESDRENNM